ncbi:MAG: hypothetical protein WC284_08410 [Candidimonas sp.]
MKTIYSDSYNEKKKESKNSIPKITANLAEKDIIEIVIDSKTYHIYNGLSAKALSNKVIDIEKENKKMAIRLQTIEHYCRKLASEINELKRDMENKIDRVE